MNKILLLILLLGSANKVSGDCRLEAKPTYHCDLIEHSTQIKYDKLALGYVVEYDRLIAWDIDPYTGFLYPVDYTSSPNMESINRTYGYYTLSFKDGSVVTCRFIDEVVTNVSPIRYGNMGNFSYRKVLP